MIYSSTWATDDVRHKWSLAKSLHRFAIWHQLRQKSQVADARACCCGPGPAHASRAWAGPGFGRDPAPIASEVRGSRRRAAEWAGPGRLSGSVATTDGTVRPTARRGVSARLNSKIAPTSPTRLFARLRRRTPNAWSRNGALGRLPADCERLKQLGALVRGSVCAFWRQTNRCAPVPGQLSAQVGPKV